MTAFPNLPYAGLTTLTFAGVNSLASGASALSGGVISNDDGPTERFDEIWVEIVLGSFNPGSNAIIEGALIPSFDATNYVSIAGTTFPICGSSTPYAFSFVDTGAAAKRVSLVFFNVRPVSYKLCLKNSTAAAFNASGNTVQYSGTLRETR
jgi:hypothetical protein